MYKKIVYTFTIIITLLITTACESTTYKQNYQQEKDTTPPIIELKGKQEIILKLGEHYREFGVNAYDNYDGDISNLVNITGSVNSNKVGFYTLNYSVKDSNGNISKTVTRVVRVTTFATAQLGNLANATAYIYKIDSNGTKHLVYQQDTSNSYELDKIGNFDTHADSIDKDTLYLFAVYGGKDWDSNDNGIKDSSGTTNNGTIRAYATGEEILNAKNGFKVTLVSELLYEAMAKDFKYSFNLQSFKDKLNQKANTILKSDIDGSGDINNLDIITFNPVENKSNLSDRYRANYTKNSELIHENRLPILNSTSSISNLSTQDFARFIKLSQNRTKAFIADGNRGLFVADIQDSSKPKFILNIDTPNFARAVALNSTEDTVYIADSDSGLQIVNLISKSIVGSVDLNGTARALALDNANDKIYVATESAGVKIVDISDSTNPTVLDTIATPDKAYGVTLSSDKSKLFIADNKTGMIIIDLATKTTLDTFNTYGLARGVTLSSDEKYAIIADAYKGIVVADISNLTDIKYVSHAKTDDFAREVKLSSDEKKAYVADTKGNIQVIDLSNIHSPKIVNSITTPYRSYSLELGSDNIAYVATGINGLEIIDLNELSNPAILGSLKSAYKAYAVKLKGNYAYIAQGYKGLQVVNISDKFSPTQFTTIDTSGFAIDLAIEGNTVYVADGYKGLQKIDISSPDSPTLLNRTDSSDFTNSVKLIDNTNYIIVSDGESGVKILDKSDLSEISNYKTDTKAGTITLDSTASKAYVAMGTEGILVLDISNPSTISKITTIDTSSYAKSITLKGDKGYIAGGDGGVFVVNLTTNQITKAIPTGDFASSITISNGKAYVSDYKDGLSIIDLKKEELLGTIDTKGVARTSVIKGIYAYVADSENGLVIIDLDMLK